MPVSAFVLLTSLLLLGTGAIAQSSDTAKTLPEGVVANVNGRLITEMAMENVARQLTESGEAANRDQILDELINLELLTQAAEELELENEPEIASALQLQYIQTMANAYLARKSAEMIFSEDELRAEYDSQSASVDRAEFRASHILLENKSDAEQVLADLAAGMSFEELAKTRSIDPAGENGGDLGWFQSNTLPSEFTREVASMETGEISKNAVRTEYGYHVIRLDDKRETALPDFESVKTGLTNLAMRKALSKHVDSLRSAASIVTR